MVQLVTRGLLLDTMRVDSSDERIAELSKWLDTADLPDGIIVVWAGDQVQQAESQAFLGSVFTAALGLVFIILLPQFNSIYNSVLVLVAVAPVHQGRADRHAGDG